MRSLAVFEYLGSVFTEGDDSDFSEGIRFRVEGLARYLEESIRLVFVHDGHIRGYDHIRQFARVEQPHGLTRIENSEGSVRDAFLNSSHHPVFRVGRNDRVGISLLCGRYLSGKRHRSGVERGNLPTDLVPDYEAVCTERIGKSLDELRPDSKRF